MLVRDPVLRGVREVAGLLFEPGTDPARILGQWRPGSSLARLDNGSLVLRFAPPVLLRCELAAALPLVPSGRVLVALPLEGPVEHGSADVVRLHFGRLVGHRVVEAVDPAVLLDLSRWRVRRVVVPPVARPRASSSAAAIPLAPQAEQQEFETRAKLGAQPQPTPQDRREWQRLQPPPQRGGGTAASGRRQASVAPLDWLYRRRQQKYLDQLTALFASGQVEEALRRALPLGGEPGERLATGVPGRRAELRMQFERSPGGVIDVELGLRRELEQRYRSAFTRLEQEGRILDAAFVLADLLHRTDEACLFLERHGEIRLAAELSEARGHDHGETVRLWWKAGDRPRAVAVARRHGAFAPAVQRLERAGDRAEAGRLRQEWMAHLLASGDIVTAYDVGADLTGDEADALRHRLIDIGVDHGGRLRARMLARQLRAGQGAPHPELDKLLADPWARQDRLLLAKDLAARKTPVDHPDAARAVARYLLADPEGADKEVVETVVALAKDPALRTDLPALGGLRTVSSSSAEPLWVECDATDRGQVGVVHARLLVDGRVAVATDGAGVRVVKPNGKTAAEFDVNAQHLVPSDNGTRLLALRAVDVNVFSVTVLDLVDRRSRELGDVPATAWADSYDGAQWFVANGTALWMLDILADGPSALWRSEDVGEAIWRVERHAARRWLRLSVNERPLYFSLPELTPFFGPSGEGLGDDAYLLSSEGDVGEGNAVVVVRRPGVEAPVAAIQLQGARRVSTHVDHDGTLVVGDDCGRVEVVDLVTGTRVLSLRLAI